MQAPETYQLKLSFCGSAAMETKAQIKTTLNDIGVHEYVEGVLDELDIDCEFGLEHSLDFDALGGDSAPILIFRFEEQSLRGIKAILEETFSSEALITELSALQTASWQDGWKDHFPPIKTAKFFVYPPWFHGPLEQGFLGICIEPGLAFGTGHHATTHLCLKALETLPVQGLALDVGTGTGLLAIALKKSGWKHVAATDIDPDALKAARANGQFNEVFYSLWPESLPLSPPRTYELIVANILGLVLKPLFPQISHHLAPGGHIILSGLLKEEKEGFITLAADLGLRLEAEYERDGWIALTFAGPKL